jgi:hypothetical protein
MPGAGRWSRPGPAPLVIGRTPWRRQKFPSRDSAHHLFPSEFIRAIGHVTGRPIAFAIGWIRS